MALTGLASPAEPPPAPLPTLPRAQGPCQPLRPPAPAPATLRQSRSPSSSPQPCPAGPLGWRPTPDLPTLVPTKCLTPGNGGCLCLPPPRLPGPRLAWWAGPRLPGPGCQAPALPALLCCRRSLPAPRRILPLPSFRVRFVVCPR